jgi:hypothetical protein
MAIKSRMLERLQSYMFTTRVDDYITNETLMHVNISKRFHSHTPAPVFDMLLLLEEIN